MRFKTVHLAVKMALLRQKSTGVVSRYPDILSRLIAYGRQTGKPSRDRLSQPVMRHFAARQRILNGVGQRLQEGIDREIMRVLTGRAETPTLNAATFSGPTSREDVMAACLDLQMKARRAQGLCVNATGIA